VKRRFLGVDRVHFVGIGGIGMCGIAEVLLAKGLAVSGTDLQEGATLARLRRLGAEVALGHEARHLGGADVVVVSSAIRDGNPEVEEARRRGIPVIPRAAMLAELMRLEDGIAVAGTHGKTTTTSLIAHVLDATGLDPTAVVGGRVIGSGAEADRTGVRLGSGGWLVAEADESDGSFLRLSPVMAVVTNVEPEHLDHYGTAEALDDAFVSFLDRLPFFGRAIVCVDDAGVQRLLPRITARRVTYGTSAQAEWCAGAIAVVGTGIAFDVRRGREKLGRVTLPMPGEHNVRNALAALAVAAELDVPFSAAADALSGFGGIERRFETKGEAKGIRIVDDYGHHPTEILATLAAARSVHAGRVVVVFQPHRFSRTRDLFDDFAACFHDADLLVVTDVYPAGEPPIPGADAAHLVEAIRGRGHRDVRLIASLDEIVTALPAELRAGDLVVTLGAGSVSRVGEPLLRALEAAR
jgi:UDP-N-acetylmuramate--alanine ligase